MNSPAVTSQVRQVWLANANEVEAHTIGLADAAAELAHVAPGDWLLVADADGTIHCIGCVFRVRYGAPTTTVFFDLVHHLKTPRPLSDIGFTIPSAALARIRMEDITAVLAGDGLGSVEDVRRIEDPAYVRELLEMAVRDDLLGPANGPDELVLDMSVRDRYLVGKLAPRRAPDHDAPDVEVPPADQDEEFRPADLGENPAYSHEPGAEFNRASGRVEPEDDATDEIDTSNNQSMIPSSMGMTFCVGAGVTTLQLEARWGRYERVPNDEHDFMRMPVGGQTGGQVGKKVKVWRRVPCGGQLTIPVVDGPLGRLQPDSAEADVALQGMIRTNVDGDRLVTVFLVNGQTEPDTNVDSAWLFQPEIIVQAPQDAPDPLIFRRKPSTDVIVDDPERDHLGLIYRRRVEFAVGHGVAVHATLAPEDTTRAVEIRTVVIPDHEVQATETPGLDRRDRPPMQALTDNGLLDMRTLAEMELPDLANALATLIDDYALWISEQRARIGQDVLGHDLPARGALDKCQSTLDRLREGARVLLGNSNALAAFRFANRAMALQRVRSIYALKQRRNEIAELSDVDLPRNRSWRPFQLAFLLLSVPSLSDPKHVDRTNPAEAIADLLWFPTGGGKTEAYLGVAAFAMGIRRLQGTVGGFDGSRGLTVIMRYTLRLLTLQQFQRAATLLSAMETLRWDQEGTWGNEPFTLGLWVGNKVTPGTTEKSHEAVEVLRNNDRNRAGLASPAQLTSCPWCGTEVSAGRDIEVDRVVGRTAIYCGDRTSSCDFSKAKSHGRAHPGIPVIVVDEEIYHRPPSMLIATVDKFAMMAWKPQVRTLFGQVSAQCSRHGLLWPDHECGGGHRARQPHPSATVKVVRAVRPPDLIVQDEFHLISGPLGTMVGLYETAVDELCSWHLHGVRVRPKVVASTATVRRASDQVRNVFMRQLAIFPPKALDVEDDFFSVQRPILAKPGRRYMGICAPGSSRPAVLIRTYTAFLTAAQALFDRFGAVADPYMTLVGYFNSLRELGGMKRLAEDDVQTRAFRVQMSLVDRPALAQRSISTIRELTSRVSSQDIPRYLDQLEVKFKAAFDPATFKYVTQWAKGELRAIDVVLATNMLSVGVDVNRLGIMVVNGQPKGTAEYIQATSRVGRQFPGLVASVFTWARPRDLSHYETFEHYHATFYQHVEAQSVTPFSPRALDRGLTGTMLSLIRNRFDVFAPNPGAAALSSPSLPPMVEVSGDIADRCWEVTEDAAKKNQAVAELKKRADDWAKEAGIPGRGLVYQRHGASPTDFPLLETPGLKPWTTWTVPTSMREVEPGVRLIIDDNRTYNDPQWAIRAADANKEQK